MKVVELKDLKNIPVSFTLGSFDGFHKGHAVLLNRLKTAADMNGSGTLVISFYPHPRQVIDSEFNLKLLNDRDDKMSILTSFGVDYIHFIDFSKDFAATGFDEFYENNIFSVLKVKSIIIGENHGFGRNRKGNSALLEEICKRHSVELIKVEPVSYKNSSISSTRIRNCIAEGNFHEANTMLGYEYSLKGTVEKGKGIGKELGFSTANISMVKSEKVIPGYGVYLTKVVLEGTEYFGVSNCGHGPTTAGQDSPLLLETHIFDFDMNIYGKDIIVRFIEKIRDEHKFPSIGELKFAVEKDIKFAKFQINKLRGSE